MAKKRSDGRYSVTTTLNGKRRYFYGTTRKEAIEKRDNFIKETSLCERYDGTITLHDWSIEWMKIKESSVSAKTKESYEWIINNYILHYLGTMKIADISPVNIQAMIRQLEHLSNRTITYTLTVLSSILKEAVRYGYIPKNAAALVKKPKKERNHDMVTLSKEQVKEFLKVVALDETRTLFKLAFVTGLRRSEILGLRWEDINWKKSTISVNQTVIMLGGSYVISKTTKHASSRRTMSIDDETLVELKKHRLQIQKRMLKTYNWCNNDLVFPGKYGNPRDPKSISKACKKYAASIGVPNFTMHGIRHTHATLLIEAGVNFKIIQMRLGHSSYVETMNTYSHITPLMEADVVSKISTIF